MNKHIKAAVPDAIGIIVAIAIVSAAIYLNPPKEKIVTIEKIIEKKVEIRIPVERIVYKDIITASGSASMATLPTSTITASGTVTQDGITMFYQCNASSTPVIVSKDDKILSASNTMEVQGTASVSGKAVTVEGGAWWDKAWVGGVAVGLILILGR